MKQRKLIDSFNFAIEGFFHVLKSQRNMRIHFAIALLVIVGSIFFPGISRIEWLFLCSAITLVLLAEMLNTSLEYTIDLITNSHNEKAKLIKDIGAGSVLLASIYAAIVGYFVFFQYWRTSQLATGIQLIRNSSEHITFICIFAVVVIGIVTKVACGRGTPMRGGMPSVHSAIAFSIWTITIFLIVDKFTFIPILVLVLAVMVARARIGRGIHTFWEVVVGALMGILVTVLLFQILS